MEIRELQSYLHVLILLFLHKAKYIINLNSTPNGAKTNGITIKETTVENLISDRVQDICTVSKCWSLWLAYMIFFVVKMGRHDVAKDINLPLIRITKEATTRKTKSVLADGDFSDSKKGGKKVSISNVMKNMNEPSTHFQDLHTPNAPMASNLSNLLN